MSVETHSLLHRKSSPQKDRGTNITIPNIPKVLDERGRMKLMSDYDKYESELFKHHIGTPETTRTIGMNIMPTDFDRRIPSRDEPTIAEREFDARRAQRASKKRRCNTASLVARLHGGDAGHFKPRNVAADLHAAAPEGDANERRVDWIPSLHTVGRSSVQEATSHSSLSKNKPILSGDISTTTLSVPSPRATASELKSQEKKERRATPARPTLTESAARKPMRRLSLPSLLPSEKFPPTQQPNEGEKVVKKTGEGATTRKKMMRPHPPSTAPGSTPRVDASSMSSLKVSSPGRDSTWDAEHCGRLLRVVVNSPPEYSMSFQLDLRNIDLSWMRDAHYPRSLVTLQAWRHDEGIGGGASVINSPRSVLVLLRNGVAVADLIPTEVSDDDASLPHEKEAQRMVKRMRLERRVRCCEMLLENLRAEHMSLCSNVNLPDILKAFQTKERYVASWEMPTSIFEGHERQKRVLETTRKQLEKQLMFAKDVHERQLVAEQRQQHAENEARQRLERKKEDAEHAQRQAMERMASRRKKVAELEEFYQMNLQQRLLAAEKKNASRIEARKRQTELRRSERERKAAERQERLGHVLEFQMTRKLALQQKYEEKERKLKQLSEEQNSRRRALREKILERAAKSEELAELVRQRAAFQEERVRQAAVEQNQKVEGRILQFRQRREEERARRIVEEAEKRKHIKKVFEAATEKLVAMKTGIMENLQEHEQRQMERKQRQQTEAIEKRERERAELESKNYALLRSRRAAEFKKVEKVLHLITKREAVEFLEKQREAMLLEAKKSRIALLEEREALKKQIFQQKHTLQ